MPLDSYPPKMSIETEVLSWYVENDRAGLMVLRAIAARIFGRQKPRRRAFVKISTLAHDTWYEPLTIKRAIKRLSQQGYLIVYEQQGYHSVYIIPPLWDYKSRIEWLKKSPLYMTFEELNRPNQRYKRRLGDYAPIINEKPLTLSVDLLASE